MWHPSTALSCFESKKNTFAEGEGGFNIVEGMEKTPSGLELGGFPKFGVPHTLGVPIIRITLFWPHILETTIYGEALASACQHFSSGENPGISVRFESKVSSFWRVVGRACGRADHNQTKFVNSETVL